MPYVIYHYRLLEPLDWDEDCLEHLQLQTKMWNTLVGIEQAYRKKHLKVLASDITLGPILASLDKLQSERTKLRVQRKEMRRQARCRVPTPLIDQCLEEMAREKTALAALAQANLQGARERMREKLRVVEQERFQAAKLARRHSGLWWGNYGAIFRSYQVARHKASKNGTALRFHEFHETGRFTVRISPGITPEQLTNKQCTRISLDLTPQPVPWRMDKPARVPRVSRSGRLIGAAPGREGPKRPRLTFTVYTTRGEGGFARRTLTYPIIYDRPLPAEGSIREVIIKQRRVGTKLRHHVAFCVHLPDAPVSVTPPGKICGINFGFRQCGDHGLRVAVMYAKDTLREVKLPASWLEGMKEVGAIQQHRDLLRNDIAAALNSQWPHRPNGTPGELEELFGHFVQYPRYGASKLSKAVLKWRRYENYWPAMRYQLESWRRENTYWLEIQSNKREHLQAQRREIYRLFASDIAKQYGTIAIGEIKLRQIAMRENEDGSENFIPKAVRLNQYRAALSILKKELRYGAAKTGAALLTIEGGYSRKCHKCDAFCEPSPLLTQRCRNCWLSWDQDENAAINIFRTASAHIEDGLRSPPYEMHIVPSESDGTPLYVSSQPPVGWQ